MMSNYAKTITAFTHLVENKPELFSTRDWANLDKLITPVADETKGLSNALLTWCDSQPEIDEALSETEEALFPDDLETERGAGGTGYPEMTPEKERTLREQLINHIRRNTPAASQDGKPKPDSSQPSR
ncbi:MAG: hypothetical protein VSS75_021450 [Candidatus Parabeggiatoa sp.]|nr:hypothetical protein [Candidatus Parabeggiatoa sp.]